MGTKRLSRSIIEGGRTHWYGHECRAAQRGFRAAQRDYAQGIDKESWEASGEPRRRKVRVSQHDKLGAPRRWLRAQRGRRWDDVYADICARFDTRTIAGQHIVYDHLLQDVDHGHDHDHRYRNNLRSVVVDEQGLVQLPTPGPKIVYRHHWPGRPTPVLAPWVGERRVARRGRWWYWFVPVRTKGGAPQRYRLLGALDRDEAITWEEGPAWEREELTLGFDEEERVMPR